MGYRQRTIGLFMAVAILLSQVAFAHLRLGRLTFATASAPSIRSTVRVGPGAVRQALTIPSFVRRIGGVVFGEEAVPAGASPTSIVYQYDPHLPDGHRLWLKVDGVSARTYLHDWEMVPIINFVESNQTECVTAFGELQDRALTRQINRRAARHMRFIYNYAAAFNDNLVGIRLMQADMIFVFPEMTDVMMDDSRNPILGAGEARPDPSTLLLAQLRRSNALRGMDYISYILTDRDTRVTFSTTNGSLTIEGDPHYFFWRFGPRNQVEEVPATREARDFKYVHSLNPTVFYTVQAVVQYGAFFRYLRNHHPYGWPRLLAAVRGIAPLPHVETPTHLIP